MAVVRVDLRGSLLLLDILEGVFEVFRWGLDIAEEGGEEGGEEDEGGNGIPPVLVSMPSWERRLI
ncbi:MAG: hypothetical protein UT14_C0033G0013 [Candidatus Shapirobacteria bacterium GW2011_GWE1_38_92]|uniref:Uncharacterized protein n=1 Tax=Candidatus Shapirobacteria bacterium GW2011_GWE1_38_92 TaxID=1618489 RepID=A0A0G0LFK1_9BACT|nr:MAG: hypothetical protein UT14_C0033G0013 [Candidatus Shapirobacteria bacterium GW2011_GWE1_38_92]